MYQGVTPSPDRVFVKRLKQMDKRLGIYFDRNQEKFVITYSRASGEKMPLYELNSETGSLRQPDERDLKNFYRPEDTYATLSVRERLDKLAHANELNRSYGNNVKNEYKILHQ